MNVRYTKVTLTINCILSDPNAPKGVAEGDAR